MTRIADFFFESVWGKVAAAIAGLVALVTAFAWDQRAVGKRDAVLEINNQAQQQVQEAVGARERVPDRGNVEWLRKHRCRDC